MVTHNKNNDYTGFLGNRMWQIASTTGIAIKNDQPYGFQYNGYMGPFKNFRYCNAAEILGKHWVDVPENSFGYRDVKLQPNLNHCIGGYRQSRKYFQHCEDEIRRLFEFRDNFVEQAKEQLGAIRLRNPDRRIVGLHIRMGDYMNLKEHHTCLMDTNYYFNAVNIADIHTSVFVVFSNDHAGATEFMKRLGGRLKSLVYEVLPIGTAHQGVCIMSLCDGIVIANSSMSWFGAFLGEARMQIILAPQKEKWFGPAYVNMQVDDIIPTSWRQVIC